MRWAEERQMSRGIRVQQRRNSENPIKTPSDDLYRRQILPDWTASAFIPSRYTSALLGCRNIT
ncbi:hypothetical protein OIDMADRAFT_16509 [Oidiodendron maius Zn]|uniref:Uncharacterized protein n=1 Tax=Oidiodendron maius (strain Zn) TaxID=913774 RepID=A0A0C3E1H9_OIDMZ|nr:hypothetical protein OIDMADRAFT_16509 [Oidiodendron maius Zn]